MTPVQAAKARPNQRQEWQSASRSQPRTTKEACQVAGQRNKMASLET